jgi:hypothetical protein
VFERSSFFFSHLDFWNLWAFLDLNSLVLNCWSFIFHFWDRKPHIELFLKLLINIIKCKFHYGLPKASVLLRVCDNFCIPNEIIYLNRISLFISIFSHTSQRQWNSYTLIGWIILFLIFLSYSLFLHPFNHIMIGKIDKDFLSSCHILRLDNKSSFWLNYCATFLINDGVPVGICMVVLHGL